MGDADHIHACSAYRAEFAPIAGRLAQGGANNLEIARALGVNDRTLRRWRHQHPPIHSAIIAGRDRALYDRAIGYSELTDRVVDGLSGPAVHRVKEYRPPDPIAARIWMKRCRAGDASTNHAPFNGEQER